MGQGSIPEQGDEPFTIWRRAEDLSKDAIPLRGAHIRKSQLTLAKSASRERVRPRTPNARSSVMSLP